MTRQSLTLLPAVAANQGPIEIAVSVYKTADLPEFDCLARFVVSTGAARVQTYMTPDECRKLASMLLDCAVDLQRQINAQVPA